MMHDETDCLQQYPWPLPLRPWPALIGCCLSCALRALPGSDSAAICCSTSMQAGLQRVQALVKQHAGTQQQGRAVLRGPLLASAELELRQLQLPPAQELRGLSLSDGAAANAGGEGLAGAVLQCFSCFGHLSSCAADVRCGLHHHAAGASSVAVHG